MGVMKIRWSLVLPILWFVVVGAPLAVLSGFHMVPYQGTQLPGKAIEDLAYEGALSNPNSNVTEISRSSSSQSLRQLHHFLGGSCGCSVRIINYLTERRAQSDFTEHIHLINGDESLEKKLQQAGYQVHHLEEEKALSQYNIQSVPQLVVLESEKVLYQGGYNKNQMHQSDYRDLEIARAVDSKAATTYPLFGCANGALIKTKTDPWGLKYDISKSN